MIRSCYIGWATDASVRARASSGGVGSSLVKMLFDTHQITASLSFVFERGALKYRPTFVKRFSEYSITGSIYQEMDDIFAFYKAELTVEKLGLGPVAVFALPCQVRAIRIIAATRGIKVIVLGLVCSSQQSMAATDYLLRRLGLDKGAVCALQYRGNGWPSGVQIKLKDGTEKFVSNNGSVWTHIFHSRLFVSRRCFACEDTLNKHADIVLADPWLERIMATERVGKTLLAVQTELGERCLHQAVDGGYVEVVPLESSEFEQSQAGTVERKKGYRRHKNLTRLLVWLVNNRLYRHIAVEALFAFRVHERIKTMIERRMTNH